MNLSKTLLKTLSKIKIVNKSKFMFFYNGIPFLADSIEEVAEKIFGMTICRGNNNNWFVYLNGEKRMEYISKENGGNNGYTEDEVKRNFIKEHFNTNYKNTALYRLCE